MRGHVSTVRCLKVLDGRPIAISGSRDATLRVWDIEQGIQLRLLAGHQHSVRCIEISGNKVVSGSYDTTCRVSFSHLHYQAELTRLCRSGMLTLENACMCSMGISIRSMLSLSMA